MVWFLRLVFRLISTVRSGDYVYSTLMPITKKNEPQLNALKKSLMEANLAEKR
jgi:hypothetical protein